MQQQAAIQQEAPSQPEPSWWTSQATATLLGATLVLVGVILTLKHNWNRLEQEGRAKQAKDREDALREQYGDFAAAAFEYGHLSTMLRLMQMTTDGLEKITIQNPTDFNRQQLQGQRYRVETTRKRFVECLSEMLASQARLRLLHDSVDCLQELEGFYKSCENNQQWDAENRIAFESNLRDFLARVATRLAREHEDNAKHGIPIPPQVVRD